MKLVFSILGLILLLIVGTFFVFKDSLKVYLKHERAERLFEEAQIAFESGDFEQASIKSVAAHYQNPDSPGIVALAAQARLKLKLADSLRWWRLALEKGAKLPLEDLKLLIRILLANNQAKEALDFLMYLVNQAGSDPEVRELWLQSLKIRNQLRMASALTDSLLADASSLGSWQLHLNYLNLLAARSDEAVDDYLIKLLESEGEFSRQAAMEILKRSNKMSENSLREALAYIGTGSKLDEQLIIQGVQWNLGIIQSEEIQDELLKVLRGGKPGDLDIVVRWIDWMGLEWTSWFTQEIKYDEFVAAGGLSEVYWQFLVREQDWDRLLHSTSLEGEYGSFDRAIRFYFRGVAELSLGSDLEGKQDILLSATVVPLENAPKLERFLLIGEHYNALSKLYGRWLDRNPDQPDVIQKNLVIQYSLGEQDKLNFLIDRIPERLFQDNIQFTAFLSYLRLLLDNEGDSNHHSLELLLGKYPEYYDYRMLLAFSWKLKGNDAAARLLMENVPPMVQEAPRYFRVLYAFLSGKDNLLLPEERENLLPREKYLLHLLVGDK